MIEKDKAIAAWTRYCEAFGHDPATLLGRRLPGLEAYPMTPDMVCEVRAKIHVGFVDIRPSARAAE
jgi:hypothetical protein